VGSDVPGSGAVEAWGGGSAREGGEAERLGALEAQHDTRVCGEVGVLDDLCGRLGAV